MYEMNREEGLKEKNNVEGCERNINVGEKIEREMES